MRLSKAARTTKATSLLASKNLGTIEIYSGVVPTSVDTALSGQVKLASFALPNPAGVITTGGLFTANAVSSVVGLATGVAAWYRQVDPDGITVMGDGSVGTSGADLIIDNLNIAIGQTLNFTSWTHLEGNAD